LPPSKSVTTIQKKLSNTFKDFFDSEKSSGILLVVCTVISLVLANAGSGSLYLRLWHAEVGGLSVEQWINDALMAVFFLLIGLELERELYNGELSRFKNASLPVIAALGGVIAPALIHFSLNVGTATQAGAGIPMATDIAFSLGVLALLGRRVPASLKVFVVAFAVIDDLCAIIVIAVFYTAKLSMSYLLGAVGVWIVLFILKRFKVVTLIPYLAGGVLMWFLMLKSGVHATIAGVLLAFAIPLSAKEDDATSPSHRLEHFLQKPVAFIILPIFALANTGIQIGANWAQDLTSANSLGIVSGLTLGKPIGITLLSFVAVSAGVCRLPLDLNWKHLFGAGLLGGVGFTVSIFITNLAFVGRPELVNSSKIAILLASLIAGTIGFMWLKVFGKPKPSDTDLDTMDFEVTEI
jgi:Na+:H+ antiporter, NhaA family